MNRNLKCCGHKKVTDYRLFNILKTYKVYLSKHVVLLDFFSKALKLTETN